MESVDWPSPIASPRQDWPGGQTSSLSEMSVGVWSLSSMLVVNNAMNFRGRAFRPTFKEEG